MNLIFNIVLLLSFVAIATSMVMSVITKSPFIKITSKYYVQSTKEDGE